jgi:hypothetical protein
MATSEDLDEARAIADYFREGEERAHANDRPCDRCAAARQARDG